MSDCKRRLLWSEERHARRLKKECVRQKICIRELQEICEWQKARICELEKENAHDPLTGLRNLQGFEEQVLMRIEKMSHKNRSDDVDRSVIIFIDVDHFKKVNDDVGHGAGDEILRILANVIRNEDMVIRRSGDEFFIVLFGINKQAAGVRLVEMRTQFEVAVLNSENLPTLSFLVSFSFGTEEIAHSANMESLKTAMYAAEVEMYKYKKEREMGR